MSICIVDNNDSHCARLTTMLEAGGYSDIMRVGRLEAMYQLLGVDQPTDHTIDLLLMESSMPDGSGIEACRRIKDHERTRDIPIIIVTSSLEVDTFRQAFDAGAMDYLIKPISSYELLGRVRSALRLKQEIDQRQARHKEVLELLEYLEAANGMLITQQQKSDRLLHAIYEIGEHLHTSSDLKESLHSLIASIKGIVAYDAAEICVYDTEQQQLITAISANSLYTNYVLDKQLVSPIDDVYHQRMLNKESVLIRNITNLRDQPNPLIHSDEIIAIEAYLGIPLLFQETVVGTLELGSKTADIYSDAHLRFLQSVALQAATVIVQGQEKLRREAHLQRQMQEITIAIDAESRSRQVEAITESDMFQDIMQKARRIRSNK